MFSLLQRRENGLCSTTKLYDVAKGEASKDFVQRLRLERRLEVHRGCVNSICWNENGTRILSGSDDQYLAISDPYSGKMKVSIRSGHHSNIFCAKFLPNSQDLEIVSCSGAGSIYYTQVDREDMYGKCLFDCHVGTTYELVVVPNEARTFLTCGEDGTVRWFDLRIKTSCNKERCKDDVLINCRNAVTSISVDPVLPYQLATACADGSVRVFDRRMLGTRLSGSYSNRMMTGLVTRFLAPLENKAHRITSLNYSPFSHDILVSYSAENVYLFNTQIEESKEFSKTGAQAEARETVNGEEASGTDSTNQPPTKRLRLRGDWSDTGPNARPERERSEDTTSEGQPQVNLMQRMSDMLTRWLDGSLRRRGDDQEGGAGAQPEGGNSEQQATDGSSAVPEDPESEQETGGEGGGGASLRHRSREGDIAEHRRGDLEPSTEDSDGRGTLEGSEPECEDSHEAVVSEARTERCFKNVGDLTGSEPLSAVTVQAERGGEVEEHETELGRGIVGLETRGNVCAEVGEKAEQNKPPTVCDTGYSATSSSSLVLEPSTAVRQTSSTNLSAARTVNSEDSRDSETDRGIKGSANEGSEHAISSLPQHQTLPQSLPQLAGGSTELPKGQQRAPVSRDSNRETGSSDDSMGLDSVGATVSEADGGIGSGVARSQGVAASPLTTGEGEAGTSARLEPVISLHYSEEGTTASTIHVAYTSFDIMDPPRGQIAATTTNPTTVTTAASHPPSTLTTPGPPPPPPPPSVHQSSASVSDSCYVPPAHPRVPVSSDSATPLSDPSQSVRENNPDLDNTTTATNLSQTIVAATPSSAETVTSATTNQGPVLSAPTPSTSSLRGATPRLSGISTSGSRQQRMNYGDLPDTEFHQVELDEFLEETEEDEEEREAQEEQGQEDQARDGAREGQLPGPSSSTNDERNYAALCMQSMYRRRMEEREKQAMASVYQPPPQHVYSGHRNSRTMIKESNFWGEKVVMSGSDCGRIFMWDRDTAQLIMLLEADRHVVNCLQPHPFDPVLASSGIDYDVKIWSPLEAEPCFDSEAAEEVMRRNQIMLEETRDTITVPAAFMLRVLASLNQIRAGRAGSGAGAGAGGRGSRQQEESSPGDSD